MKKYPFNNLLTNVQLIVRFCFLEKPYWEAFIYHYYNLGVRNINVIVQLDEDIKLFDKFSYPEDFYLFINQKKALLMMHSKILILII